MSDLQIYLELLRLFSFALSQGPNIRAQWEQLALDVQNMVEEGRNPTQDEWDAMLAETDLLTAQLAAAEERLNAPPEPSEG